MLPTRYISPLHAVGLTYREEGIRGLYRGYCAFVIATSIFTLCVPVLTELTVMRFPVSGNYENNINELYDEVVGK